MRSVLLTSLALLSVMAVTGVGLADEFCDAADETTLTSTRKPADVTAAEIWVKIDGPPPASPSEFTFLATDTRTPYLSVYDGAQGNKPAHYMLRWINTKGQPGPWSETATATIGA